MPINFDTNEIMKSILHDVAKFQKLEVHCPECTYFIGEYTANEMRQLGALYCNFCEKEIGIDIDPLLH